MRTLMIVHEQDCGPGVFEEVVCDAADSVEAWEPAVQFRPPEPADAYQAIITLGGSVHPGQDERHPWLATEKAFLRDAMRAEVPLLGICLGAQLLAEAAGTRTRPATRPEIGWYELHATAATASDPLFGELSFSDPCFCQPDGRFEGLQWHTYEVPLPLRAVALARSEICLQAYRIGQSAWGLQSHPEVTAEDFQLWIEQADSDPSWAQLDLDAELLAQETAAKLEPWHRFGRALADRFMRLAHARAD